MSDVTLLTDQDLYLFNEGTHVRLWEKLGAHLVDGGVYFAVWAPNAEQVSVMGDWKGSLLRKMAGDDWQRYANLRLLLGYMWTLSGKKLLFMGGELAQEREWNHDTSLDWHLLDEPAHGGVAAAARAISEDSPASRSRGTGTRSPS